MKKSLAVTAAVGLASGASAQGLDIEPTSDTIDIGESITLTVYADSGPEDYAVAGWNASVVADGGAWADPRHHISPSQSTGILIAGEIVGSSVTGILLGQGAPPLGFIPLPGRVIFWSADFSSADEGVFNIATETGRFEVYTEPGADPATRRTLTPTEGSSVITVVPAPASLALLGLGGLAAARRRREATSVDQLIKAGPPLRVGPVLFLSDLFFAFSPSSGRLKVASFGG